MINSESLPSSTSLTLNSGVQIVFTYVRNNLNLHVGVPAGYKFHMVIPNDHECPSAAMPARAS